MTFSDADVSAIGGFLALVAVMVVVGLALYGIASKDDDEHEDDDDRLDRYGCGSSWAVPRMRLATLSRTLFPVKRGGLVQGA